MAVRLAMLRSVGIHKDMLQIGSQTRPVAVCICSHTSQVCRQAGGPFFAEPEGQEDGNTVEWLEPKWLRIYIHIYIYIYVYPPPRFSARA